MEIGSCHRPVYQPLSPRPCLNQPRTLPALCGNNVVRQRFNLRQFIDGRLRHRATVPPTCLISFNSVRAPSHQSGSWQHYRMRVVRSSSRPLTRTAPSSITCAARDRSATRNARRSAITNLPLLPPDCRPNHRRAPRSQARAPFSIRALHHIQFPCGTHSKSVHSATSIQLRPLSPSSLFSHHSEIVLGMLIPILSLNNISLQSRLTR